MTHLVNSYKSYCCWYSNCYYYNKIKCNVYYYSNFNKCTSKRIFVDGAQSFIQYTVLLCFASSAGVFLLLFLKGLF